MSRLCANLSLTARDVNMATERTYTFQDPHGKLFLDTDCGAHVDSVNTHSVVEPRHVACPREVPSAVFACLNIRSLLNKFDDVVELCRDRCIDLLCLTESWHDVDSPVIF